MDPANQLLADLNDPHKYVTKTHVTVFRAHTRRGADGKPLYSVDDDDLNEIAENTNRRASLGEPNRLTIGHSKIDPNADERTQPKLVGFCLNYHAEVVNRPGGRFLAVTHTEKVRADCANEINGYPFRSVEYDPDTKTIIGCAAILRSGYLPLGAVQYASGRRIFHYAMESSMDPMAQPPVTEPDGDEPDAQFYAMFRKAMKKYSAEGAGATEPGPADLTAKPQAYQNPTAPQHYSADAYSQIQALKAQQAAMQRQLKEARATNLLGTIVDKVKFDYATEHARIVNMASDAEMVGHVNYMQQNYQGLPTGGFLPMPGVSLGGVQSRTTTDPHVATPRHLKVMEYVNSHPGVSYQEAQAKVSTMA